MKTSKDDYMRKNMYYIVSLLCITLTIASCEKREPEFFDEGANGAYFDYEYSDDYDIELNFADHIVGDPDTVSVMLQVRLLGYLMEEKRTLAVKTMEIEGFRPAEVTIDEVVFADNEYEKEIEVKVKRPEMEDSIYGICIYLDGSGDIGTAVSDKDKVQLYVTESYVKPDMWFSHMQTYLGAWSREKHIYLANLTSDNHFYLALYDAEIGMHSFDDIVNLNVSAVNAMLAQTQQEVIEVDLPIAKESDYPDYAKPYFWDEYEAYLGLFKPYKFCRFTSLLGGSNTRDIAALYASEEGRLLMVEKADDFHKLDVKDMLNDYYNYALQGYPIADYKDLSWVKIAYNVNYDVRIPFWWEDPKGIGTGEIVKKYFGEYADDKYQFMLKTVLQAEGADNFVAASLLPFVYDEQNKSYAWDNSPLGPNQLAGEERLKECYRIIKQANDRRPSVMRFDIPEVEI